MVFRDFFAVEGWERMKKKLALAVVTGAIILVGATPGLVLRGVTRCQVVSPQTVSHRASIRCEGSICTEEGYDLLASGLYRVESRNASLGDWVERGETLAVLAPVGSDPVLYLQTQGRGFSGAGEEAGLAALAQSYGLKEEEAVLQWRNFEVSSAGGQEEPVTVTAPVTGILTKEVPLPGSIVQPGMTICAVEGRERYFALLTVGEREAGKLSLGSQVILTGEGVGDTACFGTVRKIYPGTRQELKGATPQKVVDLEVALQPEGQVIRPGYTVKAEIFTGEPEEMMILPYESVRQDKDNTEYVLVAGSYQLEKRPITTGRETVDGVEILSGVSRQELVAVLGKEQVEPEKKQGKYLLELEKEGASK